MRCFLHGVAPQAAYVAPAVHFDGSTHLANAGLACTDNTFFSSSYWIKVPITAAATFGYIWTVDPENTFTSTDSILSSDDFAHYGMDTQLWTAASTFDVAHDINDTSIGFDAAAWYHVLISVNVTTGDGKMYINDVDLGGKSNFGPQPFTPLFSGLPFWVGDDASGNGLIADIADMWLAPGVSLLSGGDIPVSTRRAFISATGKPVDPVFALAKLGEPAVRFSGDASTFATNLGTGGTFTTTGALTDASTSPSD